MYRPHTVEQYKIYRFIKERFELEHFLLSPLSRTALMLEDHTGAQIAFCFQDGKISETDIPSPADPKEITAFIKWFRALDPPPRLKTFEEITRWWLEHPNPITYQQALNLNDDLYRHYLSHPQLKDDEVLALVSKGLVTETEYNSILLWYLDGHRFSCWLGPFGLDGTGDIYRLVIHYNTPKAREYTFYLLNDYYRYMNNIL